MLLDILKSKLLPAVTLSNADSAVLLAEAFLEAGLDVMEVTFRTDAVVPAISAIVKEFPEMNVGAGTILSPDQLTSARNAGAQFGLAPGFNPAVVNEAQKLGFPFIPGVMTPSEIEKALACGYDILKIFPVGSMGGADYIKRIEGPYLHTDLQFIPMGGVDESNLASFLSCKSVLAAGGSWLCPKNLIKRNDFKNIKKIVTRSIKIVNNE